MTITMFHLLEDGHLARRSRYGRKQLEVSEWLSEEVREL